MTNTKTNMALDVPQWANNAHKQAQVRKYYEGQKQARERENDRLRKGWFTFIVIVLLLNVWVNAL
jgi:hypothetical protein